MTEKSIKEVVAEFKEAFGMVEFKAVNNETGQVGGSKNYQPAVIPRLEIDAADYLSLGSLNAKSAPPSEGVIAGLMRIELGKRRNV